MGASVTWDGLEELRAALRQLPDELAAEASGIVIGHAQAAESEIVAAYPQGATGNLKAGMDVIQSAAGRYGAGAIVRNRSPHAWIFENGTAARHYITVKGKRHLTGRMPPGHVFIPRVIRHRRAMYESLKGLLQRHGLEVSGDA